MQIPLITAKQFNSYLLKTASKLALQKIKEVTGYLIENNIAGKVAKSYDDKIARPASQDNLDTGSKPGKNLIEIIKERYISSEKRQLTI